MITTPVRSNEPPFCAWPECGCEFNKCRQTPPREEETTPVERNCHNCGGANDNRS